VGNVSRANLHEERNETKARDRGTDESVSKIGKGVAACNILDSLAIALPRHIKQMCPHKQ
jgi:hypothetical protein